MNARIVALALAGFLGGLFFATGCGSSGSSSATAESTSLTTDQTNTVGTAAVNLALQSMSDSLSAVQASPSMSKVLDFSKSSGKATVTIGSLTLAAASNCDLPTVTACASPTRTVNVTLTGTSGTCSGTAKVCDANVYVDLTCNDYTSSGATLNGTVSFVMNNDTCDPASSVAADLSATVNGASYPISLSLATVNADAILGTSGCFAVDGSGFSFSTSINASDVATCAAGSCADDLTQLALLFSGTSCTYAGGNPAAGDTFSHDVLLGAGVDATQRQCLLYVACNTYDESGCMSYTAFEAAATGCGVSIGGSLTDISNVAYYASESSTAVPLATGDNQTIDANDHSSYILFNVSGAPSSDLVTRTCVVCDTDVGFGSAYEISCNDGNVNSIRAPSDQFKAAEFRSNCWNGSTDATYSTAFKVRYEKSDGSNTDTGTTIGINLTILNPR